MAGMRPVVGIGSACVKHLILEVVGAVCLSGN